MNTQLERVEIERTVLCDNDFTIEHTAQPQRIEGELVAHPGKARGGEAP